MSNNYFNKDLIKYLINKLGLNISRYKKNKHDQIVNLKPKGKSYGNALLGLIIDPFLLSVDEKISNKHTNHQESLEIANIFLELGYQVDVISKLRSNFIPSKKYTFYVNLRTNFKKISKYLNNDCIKIVHLDVSHWLFNNSSALSRTLDLQKRRGVALASHRHIKENYAIEHCDYATMLGNNFTISTYEYANKQIYRTNLPTCLIYDWPINKDFEKCRKNFLWFGSSGFVQKGLDLVLEAFADLSDCNLTVCGPIYDDEDFTREYHKELFETPNIFTKGWLDIDSREYIDTINNSIAIVFPSCAEGCNGGVVTCMQAGIIPIVSYQTGVDIDPEYGVLLEKTSIEEIKENVRRVSNFSGDILSSMARKAWEYARTNHTIKAFHRDYKNAVLDIVTRENEKSRNKIKLLD